MGELLANCCDRFEIPSPDEYQLFVTYCPHSTRTDKARFEVTNGPVAGSQAFGDSHVVFINQQKTVTTHNNYVLIGTFYFTEQHATVTITNGDTDAVMKSLVSAARELTLCCLQGSITLDAFVLRRGIVVDTEEKDLVTFSAPSTLDTCARCILFCLQATGRHPDTPTMGSWVTAVCLQSCLSCFV